MIVGSILFVLLVVLQQPNFLNKITTPLFYYLNPGSNAKNYALLEEKTDRIFLLSMGRLGNILFQYCMLWSLGKRTGRSVFFVTDGEFKDIFPGLTVPILAPTWHMRGVLQGMETLVERRTSNYEETLPENLPAGDVVICCYFQSFKNFWPYRGQQRRELIFSNNMRAAADRSLRSAHLEKLGDDMMQFTRFVAVHVRRGDLISSFNYNRGYRPPEPSYFYKAMAMFRHKFLERVLFIVASDDPLWTQEHLQLEDTYVSTGRSAAEDMALLAACNDTIFSMGTFGWWAAFLTPGLKVYFLDALETGSDIAWHYPLSDTFPPDWIALGN